MYNSNRPRRGSIKIKQSGNTLYNIHFIYELPAFVLVREFSRLLSLSSISPTFLPVPFALKYKCLKCTRNKIKSKFNTNPQVRIWGLSAKCCLYTFFYLKHSIRGRRRNVSFHNFMYFFNTTMIFSIFT